MAPLKFLLKRFSNNGAIIPSSSSSSSPSSSSSSQDLSSQFNKEQDILDDHVDKSLSSSFQIPAITISDLNNAYQYITTNMDTF